jgi:glycerophosphoryl diester phosphodiesterase/predicted AlkP superfamily pyrophosphatase or phosphodiesterase
MNLLIASAALFLAGAQPAAGAADRHVVVITIDGLPAYLLDDPRASLPVIRGLRDSGASAAGGIRVSNPSVTWPNHTTLMTGVHPDRHGVLFNGLPERRGSGTPVRVTSGKDQRELVRVPLLFDVLDESGLTSAAINWPCTRGSESLADNFPDVPDQLRFTTPRLKEELAGSGHLDRFEGGGGVVRDEVWTEAACRVIRERKPRLLALHLLNLDSTHHAHGPRTPPGYTAAALADAMVGRVLRALDDAGIRDRTTVFVLADHGFAAVEKTLRPNVLLRREGLLTVEGDRISSARAHVIPEGGIGMVYLTDPDTADRDREAVRRLFREAEGIAAVVEPEDFPRYHLPRPGDHTGMADLVLAAKDGYAITGAATGEEFVVPNAATTGAHGYLSTEPKMNAIFVAAGAGIRAGARPEAVENIDVAPTVARLLGVKLDGAQGRALEEILDDGVAAAPDVEVIAHRGESADAPENTLAAFRLAWERGAPAIELDVHLTRDGALIVSHDADARRITGEPKVIRESALAELRTLDAGRWKGERWAGERMPTLDEALATIPANGRCFVEVKVGPEAIPALAESVHRSGKRPEQLAIISFHAEALAEAKRRLPGIQAYYLASFRRDEESGAWRPDVEELIGTARRIGADGLDLSAEGPIDREFARRVKAAGLELYIWTVDEPAEARRFAELGVDGITTNRAGRMKRWLDEPPGSARPSDEGCTPRVPIAR